MTNRAAAAPSPRDAGRAGIIAAGAAIGLTAAIGFGVSAVASPAARRSGPARG